MLTKVEGTKLTFNVNGKIKAYELEEVFELDDDDLTKEMVRQASFYGFFSGMLSAAEWGAVKAKAKMEQEYGTADEVYRAEILTAGEKIRETAVKGMVLNDADYIEAEAAYQNAIYFQSVLNNVCRTLSMKSDMLINIGAQARAEISMIGMKIREKGYGNAVEEMKDKLKKD
jgi:hypothetical protein